MSATSQFRVMALESESVTLEQYVVCVDDDHDFLKSLEFLLPREINGPLSGGGEYRFLFFGDPREALGAVQELTENREKIAMILSDQKMPGMMGVEFFLETRKLSPDSVRVLLTGHAGIEAAVTAINEALLDRYLTKPIENEHEFTLSIRHLLQRFEMNETIQSQTRTLGRLYEFSNTLNGMESLLNTAQYLASFTRAAMGCARVQVLVPDQGTMVQIAHSGDTEIEDAPVPSRLGEAQLRVSDETTLRVAAALAPLRAAGLVPDDVSFTEPATPMLLATLNAGTMFFGLLCASGGNLTDATDDVRQRTLSHIVNTASIALHQQLDRERLEDAYTETMAHAAALEAAHQKLQSLDRLKRDFLDFISHELRTPLTGLSAIGLLQASDGAEQAGMIQVIQGSYDRLQEFILRGLEYFDWLASEPVEVTEPGDLAAIVQRRTASLVDAAGRPVSVELAIPHACMVRMSEEHVDRIVETLVDNAVKFGAGGPVRIEVAKGDTVTTLRVRDQGAGFPADMAEEIVQPFTVADLMHHQRGSGLRVATVAAILAAHGGSIRAASAGVGQGAEFTVEWREAA